jgi:hypothetical protein
MMKALHLAQVGAPDPELNNSPIVDGPEDDEAAPRDIEIEQGRCYFNGTAYPIGTFVQSGDEILQCVERGVWARRGEREDPD